MGGRGEGIATVEIFNVFLGARKHILLSCFHLHLEGMVGRSVGWLVAQPVVAANANACILGC